ncbi:MAG: S-layer protein [Candidatus Micrarchaeota archaeon]|nr:S-layer protein [Candidatus Micrarchaeota archaeon]
MKGINVKKIAAFAGAAVLFGAAAVAAEVTYGSTQLVDQSGQPTVKIYVGTKAMISDGVAAANIAAKIANEAYKSSTLTASVSGTPTCTVGSGVSGAGACSIVESSKKVTLEVTLPGTVSGTHTFKTLITDTIDRTLENRNYSKSEDMYNSTFASTDTSGVTTSPLRIVDTGDKGRLLYRIGSGQFTGFADYAVTDDQATSSSYTEEQSFWVGSNKNAVQYDSSSSVRGIDVNKYSAMAYSVKFTGNDYGIPVCTGGLASNTSDDWTSCSSTGNDMTDRHRVKIKFMGSEWVISEMKDPSATDASSVSVVEGGQIKLAKEAKYGIINVGGELDAGTFKVRLSDISVATGGENTHPAILDILDANDAVVGQVQVSVGTTYTFTQSGTSNQVKIHVYNTAPGFTLNAKWAEMAVFTDEITLKSGSRYNLVSGTDVDQYFKVDLLWKNKDYSGGTSSTKADSLREIVVYNVDGFSDKTKAGDVVNFLQSTPTFKVTYQGVGLTSDDYVPLTYSGLSSDSMRIATTAGDKACSDSSDGDAYFTGKLIEIKTSGQQLLGGTGGGLDGYLLEKIRVDPSNAYNLSTGLFGTFIGTLANKSVATLVQNFSQTNAPVVFYQVSGRNCWNWNVLTYAAADTSYIKFDTAGANSAAQGRIFFTTAAPPATLGTAQGNIVLAEDAGKLDTSSNTAVYTYVPFIQNASYQSVRFKAEDSSTQQVWYKGLDGGADYPMRVITSYEPTLVTERGSKVLSVGTSDASLMVAKMVAEPTFQFAYADTSSASASADQYVMGVGESKVFGGVTVKVAAIDATTGSCSVLGIGGTPACTVDSTGVNAVISPANAASVQVSQPYTLTSSMVMLDSEAVSGVAITVGGPVVNTVTAEALKDANVDFNVDNVVVKEIGNKIVVAGQTAQDTMTAADQFIAGVKRQ